MLHTVLSLTLGFAPPATDAAEADATDQPAGPASTQEEEEKGEDDSKEEHDQPGGEETSTASTSGVSGGTVGADAASTTTDTTTTSGVQAAGAPEPAPVEDPPAPTEPPAEASDAEEKPDGPTFVPGVQAFLRGEGRINPDFASGSGAANQGAVLERVRLQALGTWGPVSAFAQVQDARSWGFEASTASNDANTDLHQGWMQLGGEKDKLSGFVRLGRQEIIVGKQRLIGPLAWMPNARSFDAAMFHGQAGRFRLDLFGAMLQPAGVVTAPDPMDPMAPPLTANSNGAQLAGLVFGAEIHKAINAEVVGLFDRADARNNALTFDRKIANTGARVWGEPVDGLTYDAEGNVQFGENNTRDHFAWAWAARVDYVYKKPKVKPGGHVGYAMASGESCSGDPTADPPEPCGATDSNEFFNFYPTNHMHYGFVDLSGWRNMRELEAGVMVAIPQVLKKLEVKYHFFQLQVPDGRWSNAGGASVGAGWDPDNDDRNLGHEIDVFAVLKPWKPLFIQPGYGVFIPVGAGKKIGGDDPQHYLWLWLRVDI